MKKQTIVLFAFVITLLFLNSNSASSEDAHGLIGFTYTQSRLFIPHSRGSEVANIHIYGWGTYWPFPEGKPGEYDNGETLDKRVKQATEDGQQVVLTCATAPSNYRQSDKPWNMQERVKTDMERHYAERCAEATRRWPQISRVQVWNEFKGYWNLHTNRWDYEDYTRFYDEVYHAIKMVRPTVLVGGGYIPLSPGKHGFDKPYNGVLIDSRNVDALEYWITHAAGYDAICVDAQFAPADFAKITSFVRHLAHDKPIWWSEYYGNNITDMHTIKDLFSHNQHAGDMALWWAQSPYPW